MGCNEPIIYSNHKNNGEECNYKFNNLFLNVWYVTKYGYHSIHLQPSSIMDFGYYEILIFPTC